MTYRHVSVLTQFVEAMGFASPTVDSDTNVERRTAWS
jgi:hypothetical protein